MSRIFTGRFQARMATNTVAEYLRMIDLGRRTPLRRVMACRALVRGGDMLRALALGGRTVVTRRARA